MQFLTQKAVRDYAEVLDYEASILVRSLARAAAQGTVSVDPSSYVGRYALK
jgi:hypothetical protein